MAESFLGTLARTWQEGLTPVLRNSRQWATECVGNTKCLQFLKIIQFFQVIQGLPSSPG